MPYLLQKKPRNFLTKYFNLYDEKEQNFRNMSLDLRFATKRLVLRDRNSFPIRIGLTHYSPVLLCYTP